MKPFIQIFSSRHLLFTVIFLIVIFFSLANLAVTSRDGRWSTSGHWAFANQVGSDGATFVVTAISHNKDLGVPYKDYWEYRPPGFYLLLDLWTRAFGTQATSFKLLESLTRFLIGLQIYFVFRKILSPAQTFIATTLTLLVFFCPGFGSLLYPEPYTMLFSFLGLLSLLYIQRLSWRFFLSAFFFSISIQLKDSFGGSALALFSPLFFFLTSSKYKLTLQALFFTLIGFLLPLLFLSFYLINLHAFNAYLEVLRFKSSAFHTNIFSSAFWAQYYGFFYATKKYLTLVNNETLIKIGTIILGFLWLKGNLSRIFLLAKKIHFSAYLKQQKLFIKLSIKKFPINTTSSKTTVNVLTILLYSLGSFLGPSSIMTISPHYVFAIVIPTYFIWTILAFLLENYFTNKITWWPKNLTFAILILALLFPRSWLINEYQIVSPDIFGQSFRNLNLQALDLSSEKYIASKTKPTDCILSIYGWQSSNAYLYSERKPCTRFIIPNIVTEKWQKEEYLNAIIKNPPQAIIHSISEADMDHKKFEQTVVNFPQIFQNCYLLDPSHSDSYISGHIKLQIYFPKILGEDLKKCITTYAKSNLTAPLLLQ